VNRFGASAPGKEVLRHYGFTVEHVVKQALDLLSTTDRAC
jgi:transketolase